MNVYCDISETPNYYMKKPIASRRKFIRDLFSSSICLGVIGCSANNRRIGAETKYLSFSPKIREHLLALYGDDRVVTNASIKIQLRELIENGCHTQVKIMADITTMISLSIFIENNPQPHVISFNAINTQQNPFMVRIRVSRDSPIYSIAQTRDGMLFGNQAHLRVDNRSRCRILTQPPLDYF